MPRSAVALGRQIVEDLDSKETLAFKPLLSGPLMDKFIAAYGTDFRERVLPPDLTLMAFCSQVIGKDHSCRKAVDRINLDRTSAGLAPASSSTSAYCQARQRLPLDLIKGLAKETAVSQESLAPQTWLLHGRHIKMIDGTTLLAADSQENQVVWPQHAEQAEGLGFPILRAVGLISLATGAVCDFAFGPYKGKGTGEHGLAREIIDSINPGDMILGDRYYDSYFFIAQVLQRGADVITRLHGAKNPDFRSGKYLGPGDHLVELVKPPKPKWMTQDDYESMPETIVCRELNANCTDSEGKEVIVVTTLTDPKKYSRTEMAATYKLRWTVELDLRSLKSVMGMEFLSCKTPEMVTKEIWAYILAYNLVRELIARAAKKYHLEPRQISFTGAVQAFSVYAPVIGIVPERTEALFNAMLAAIAYNRIGNRPGRREPRAKKRRPKAQPLLKEPRAQAKKRLSLT